MKTISASRPHCLSVIDCGSKVIRSTSPRQACTIFFLVGDTSPSSKLTFGCLVTRVTGTVIRLIPLLVELSSLEAANERKESSKVFHLRRSSGVENERVNASAPGDVVGDSGGDINANLPHAEAAPLEVTRCIDDEAIIPVECDFTIRFLEKSSQGPRTTPCEI